MSGSGAELAAFGLALLIELVKKRPKLILGLIILLVMTISAFIARSNMGLVNGKESKDVILSDGPDAAEITFVSLSNMKDWIADATDLRWGIAMSSEDIAGVREKNGKLYNQPRISIEHEDFDRIVIASGIKTGEQINLKIKPGTYDWLIVMDQDNDGSWDSYLGSIEQDIRLNTMQFLANEKYEVIVGRDSVVKLSQPAIDLPATRP